MIDNSVAHDDFGNPALVNNAGGIGAGNNRANLLRAIGLSNGGNFGGGSGFENPFLDWGPDAAASVGKWGPKVGKALALLGMPGAGTIGWGVGKAGENYFNDWQQARLSPGAANNPLTYQNWDGSWNQHMTEQPWEQGFGYPGEYEFMNHRENMAASNANEGMSDADIYARMDELRDGRPSPLKTEAQIAAERAMQRKRMQQMLMQENLYQMGTQRGFTGIK